MAKEIIVIGGGPAGIEAAQAAARQGAQVTLVADGPLGGRAGWHSLLPSKVWLTAAETLATVADSDTLGLGPANGVVDPTAVLQRLRRIKEDWNGRLQRETEKMGVQITSGKAHFVDAHNIVVTDNEGQGARQLSAEAFIITSGSVPIFPPTMKPDGRRVIAPRFASGLEKLPASMVVVGGGVTGTEFVYLFNRLGVEVTWVVDQFGVLPTFDRQAGEFLKKIYQKRGVHVVEGAPALEIERGENGVRVLSGETAIPADMAFLAIGRRPDVSSLQFEAVGLVVKGGTIAVDGYGRSAQGHIYLAGDVTGSPMVANRAMAQAWVAGNHAAGAEIAPFRAESVVAAVYSAPQMAQVGTLSGKIVTLDYGAGMKPHLAGQTTGFVKLAAGDDGVICGAVAVGDHAADMLSPVAVAIHVGMDAAAFGTIYPAHPTISELPFSAARLLV